MAGKSYIRGSSKWSQIKRMYVKTGPVWTSVRKAYIKTGNVWKKMFDSSSRIPYTTETPTIRHDSYTGTIVSSLSLSSTDPTGESRIGIKLWGRENPSSWGNGPFTSQKYQWYAADNKEGINASIIKDISDTYYVGSSENNADYDGMYLFFRALYTNTYGTGTANSLPVYVHKLAPSKMTGVSGVTSEISSTATQVGTPIQFDFAWHNEYYRSVDRYASTIEWFRGYPLPDKSNRVLSTTLYQADWIVDDSTEFSGNTTYTPSINDVGSTIYVVMTGVNTYNTAPLSSAINSSPVVSTYYTNTTISTKPVINSPVTISKLDGYQTIGFRLSANTQTYTPSATTVYWGWQWASSPTAPNTSWSALQSRYFSPISYSYITTNYFGSESNQGVNHTLYIPSTAYNGSTDVSLVGKYLRFYSIGVSNGATSDTNNSTNIIGPIYGMPTSAGAPSIYFYSPYSSSQAYIRAFWNPATYSLDYTLQYQSGSTWVDALTVTDAPQYVSTNEVLVPTGNLTFRVKTRNEDSLEVYSSTVQFNVPSAYSFSFGNYLYPNTNGQIGLDSGTTSTTPAGGRLLAIYPKDLAETATGYYSDGRYYYIQFSGYQYDQVGVATYALRYQVKFDSQNPSYADVLICNKGSSLTLSTSAGLYNGSTQISGLPGPYVLQTNTTFRIYMDGSTGSFGQTQAQIPSTNFVTHSLDFGNSDDGYHSLLTATNQYQTNMLNVTSATINSAGIAVVFNGVNNYSTYSYELRTGSYNGSLWNSLSGQTANPLTIGSLTAGTRYYLTITPYNSFGQPGLQYQNFFDAPSLPQAFTTDSGSKSFPIGATQSTSQPTQNRTVTVNWNSSANSTVYEVALQGSSDNSNWVYVTIGGTQQTLDNSPYVMSGTSKTFTAPYYKYYRYTVRGRGSDYNLSNAVYSDYGSSTSLVWKNVDGTNPSAPTINSITPGTGSSYNTASATFTMTSNPGSNTIDWSQYSLDNTNWNNIYSGTISLTGLSASTGYYLYMRSLNYDGLYSSSTYQYFTTNSAPAYLTAPTPSSVSKSGSNFNVYFSGGSGPYYQTYWTSVDAIPSATGYDANGSSSPISVTNLVAPSMGTTYYFSVRSVSALTNTGTGTTNSLSISPWSSTRVSYYHPYVPTITMSANSGVGQTQATINWTSTNQSYAYVDGTYVGNVTTYTKTGLSASTPYSGTVTVYSTDGYTATGNYSFTTTAVPSYTITYNGNGNTGGSTTATTGSGSVTLRSNGFTRTNATFASWNTNSSGTGTNYSAGTSYTLSADVTLYARWTANTVTFTNPTVSFLGTSGSGASTQRSWSWTAGSVSGATAIGYQWAISSTNATSGFGAFSATTTSTSLTVTASTARWLKVRKVATDGLGTEVYSGTNNGV